MAAAPETSGAGSALESDDAALSPYNLTRATHDALVASVTELRALRLMFSPEMTTIAALGRLHGSYRAALNTIWLLAPVERMGRRTRFLQDVWSVNYALRVQQVGEDTRVPWEGDAVMWQLMQLAKACGMDANTVKSGPTPRYKAESIRPIFEERAGVPPTGEILPTLVFVFDSAQRGKSYLFDDILHAKPFGPIPALKFGAKKYLAQVSKLPDFIELLISFTEVAVELYIERTSSIAEDAKSGNSE